MILTQPYIIVVLGPAVIIKKGILQLRLRTHAKLHGLRCIEKSQVMILTNISQKVEAPPSLLHRILLNSFNDACASCSLR